MKTTRYIYTALILAALSQGNAVAQNKGGFFSKVRDTFSTEIKIGITRLKMVPYIPEK